MLKILLFWVLLFTNAGLYAYESGYLTEWLPDGHEPERMARQLNPESMKPVPVAVVEAKTKVEAPDNNDTAPTAKADSASCSEFGGFDLATAKRFDTQVQPLSLGDKLARHETEDMAHNIVYIPSQGSKEGAEKKASELRHLGVNDFYVIQDNTDLHWGISLGVFKTEEAARAQLAALTQKGVHSARLGTRSVASTRVFYQARDLDTAGRAALDKVLQEFPHTEKRACGSETAQDAKPADTKTADAKPGVKSDAKSDGKPASAKAPDTKTAQQAKPAGSSAASSASAPTSH